MNLNSWHGFCRGILWHLCPNFEVGAFVLAKCWGSVVLLLGVAGDMVCAGVLERSRYWMQCEFLKGC